MYRLEIKDAELGWVLCVEAPALDIWPDFRDACGGHDHVRAVDTTDLSVVREFIPGGG